MMIEVRYYKKGRPGTRLFSSHRDLPFALSDAKEIRRLSNVSPDWKDTWPLIFEAGLLSTPRP